MPEYAQEPALAQAERSAVCCLKRQGSICEDWFAQHTAFLSHVAFAGIIFPAPFADAPTIRAIAVFCHYGLIQRWTKCCVVGCPGKAKLTELTRSKAGHYHMREPVAGLGPLLKIKVSGWMAFLNFITLLRLNVPLHPAYDEIRAAWGNIDNKKTFRSWRRDFQDGLKCANDALHLLRIGGKRPQAIVVIDETNIGLHRTAENEILLHKRISTGSPRTRKGSRSRKAKRERVSKRTPARTVWKRPAVAFKRPARSTGAKNKASSKTDRRRHGRWLWAAVSVGHGKT